MALPPGPLPVWDDGDGEERGQLSVRTMKVPGCCGDGTRQLSAVELGTVHVGTVHLGTVQPGTMQLVL